MQHHQFCNRLARLQRRQTDAAYDPNATFARRGSERWRGRWGMTMRWRWWISSTACPATKPALGYRPKSKG